MRQEELKSSHKHSSNYRKELETSKICGCFYCCDLFNPAEITEWIDEKEDGIGRTVLCPKCGIDNVIGFNSGFLIQNSFLQEMKDNWF